MIEEERFQELVAEAWEQVPAAWRRNVENVALLVEDEPSAQVREEEKLGPHDTLLGLYHGVPNTARGEGYGVGAIVPDTITLFRLPILEEARHHMRAEPHDAHTSEAFELIVRTVIQETLWHEIGHYFGLSEQEIDEREQEGTNQFES